MAEYQDTIYEMYKSASSKVELIRKSVDETGDAGIEEIYRRARNYRMSFYRYLGKYKEVDTKLVEVMDEEENKLLQKEAMKYLDRCAGDSYRVGMVFNRWLSVIAEVRAEMAEQ